MDRSELFARALEETEQPPSSLVCRLRSASGPLCVCGLAALTASLLLLLRPPFVLSFEHDRDRPWRSKQSLSWTSLLACTLLACIYALVLSATA